MITLDEQGQFFLDMSAGGGLYSVSVQGDPRSEDFQVERQGGTFLVYGSAQNRPIGQPEKFDFTNLMKTLQRRYGPDFLPQIIFETTKSFNEIRDYWRARGTDNDLRPIPYDGGSWS